MINFSELLWKSDAPRDQGRKTALVSRSAELEVIAELQRVPVDQVNLELGSRITQFTDS